MLVVFFGFLSTPLLSSSFILDSASFAFLFSLFLYHPFTLPLHRPAPPLNNSKPLYRNLGRFLPVTSHEQYSNKNMRFKDNGFSNDRRLLQYDFSKYKRQAMKLLRTMQIFCGAWNQRPDLPDKSLLSKYGMSESVRDWGRTVNMKLSSKNPIIKYVINMLNVLPELL